MTKNELIYTPTLSPFELLAPQKKKKIHLLTTNHSSLPYYKSTLFNCINPSLNMPNSHQPFKFKFHQSQQVKYILIQSKASRKQSKSAIYHI